MAEHWGFALELFFETQTTNSKCWVSANPMCSLFGIAANSMLRLKSFGYEMLLYKKLVAVDVLPESEWDVLRAPWLLLPEMSSE